MKKIPVEQIENGMILQKDVFGPSGNVLLNRGGTLSASLANRLKNWGIAFVYVEGESEEGGTEETESVSPGDYKEHLHKKFGETLTNPVMQQIFTAVYQFKMDSNSH
jgi:hypothetical protein